MLSCKSCARAFRVEGQQRIVSSLRQECIGIAFGPKKSGDSCKAFSFQLSAFSFQPSALLRLKSLGSPANCLLHPKSHRPGGPAILIGGHCACWGWGYSEISNLELLCSFGPLPCHSRPLLAPDAWHLSPGTRNLDPVLLPHLPPTTCHLPDPWHLTPGT